RHSTAAFSLAYRMMGRRGAAEDVVQEAFLSLWRSGARYDRTRGSVRTWVLGIVHHRGIDALRRGIRHDARRASDEGIEERFDSGERTDVQAARREEAKEVLGALAEPEAAAFAAHLEDCDGCRREVAELQVVADVLPMAAPQVVPPPALKGRIMAVVDAEAQL